MVEDVLASLAGPCLSCAAARACLEAKKLKGSMCAWKGDEENGEEGKDEAEGATAPAVDAGVDADADSPFCWPLLWLFGVCATLGGECACTSSSVDDAIDSGGLVAPSLPAGSSHCWGRCQETGAIRAQNRWRGHVPADSLLLPSLPPPA